MNLTTVLVEKQKSYEIYKDENEVIYINVLCGGVGLFEILIQLNSEEILKWKNSGKFFSDNLAYEIGKNPDNYILRHKRDIKLPPLPPSL